MKSVGMMALALALGAATGEPGEWRKLASREAEVVRRTQAIDEVARWHGVYRVVRETFVEGPDGVVARSQRWLEASATWVAAAHEIVETVRAGRGHLHDAALQASLKEKQHRLEDGLVALERAAIAVKERALAAQVQLDQLSGSLAPGIVPAYAESTAFLLARRDELIDAVRVLDQQADAAEQQRWQATLAPLGRAIAAAVRAEAAIAPELAEDLDRAAQGLAADAAAYPHVAAVLRAAAALQQQVLARAYFRGREAAAALAQQHERSAASLRALDLDPEVVRDALAAVARAATAGQVAWDALTAASAPWQVVASHLDSRSRALAAECRDPRRQPYRNCALLRQFIGLTATTLQDMTEAELALIEDSLERVAAGPLS